MRGPFDDFHSEPELDTDGFWKEFDGYALKIARSGGHNMRYRDVLNEHHRARTTEDTPTVQAGSYRDEVLIPTYARAIVMDWRSPAGKGVMPIPGGKQLEYSVANCEWLLKSLPDLFDIVLDEAVKIANFRDQVIADAVGDEEGAQPGN